MTKRYATMMIWAVMAPLTHLVGGVSWSSLLSSGAKAAEPGASSEMAEVMHPAIADPANIQPRRAEEIYQSIRGNIRDHYARSGDPLFLDYQSWKRFARLPYLSPNHGERFVNHYANDRAGAYRNYEKAG